MIYLLPKNIKENKVEIWIFGLIFGLILPVTCIVLMSNDIENNDNIQEFTKTNKKKVTYEKSYS